MTAFNARIIPKLYFGVLPKYTLGGLFVALPAFVMGLLLNTFMLKMGLFFLFFFSLVLAMFFLIVGRDAPFIMTMLLEKAERHNVTVETWTHE